MASASTGDTLVVRPVRADKASGKAFEQFVKFLYTDEVALDEVGPSDVLDVAFWAQEYNMERLYALCHKHVDERLDTPALLHFLKAVEALLAECAASPAGGDEAAAAAAQQRRLDKLRECRQWGADAAARRFAQVERHELFGQLLDETSILVSKTASKLRDARDVKIAPVEVPAGRLQDDMEWLLEHDTAGFDFALGAVPCHRAILAARVPFYAAMFASGMAEVKAGASASPDGLDEAAVRALLRYIYTGRVDHLKERLVESLQILQGFDPLWPGEEAAQRHTALLEACHAAIDEGSGLRPDNCVRVFAICNQIVAAIDPTLLLPLSAATAATTTTAAGVGTSAAATSAAVQDDPSTKATIKMRHLSLQMVAKSHENSAVQAAIAALDEHLRVDLQAALRG